MKTCNDCKFCKSCIMAAPDGKWTACEQFEEEEMDLINRQAAIKACGNSTFAAEAKWVIEHLPSASQWIPVKMRRMTAEEQKHFEEYYGAIDNEFTEVFDCPMPNDGQDILITTPWGVSFDTCDYDGDGFALEDRGDWEDVIAWMPLPQPYKGE